MTYDHLKEVMKNKSEKVFFGKKQEKEKEVTEIDGLLIFPSIFIVIYFLSFIVGLISLSWTLIDLFVANMINIFSVSFLFYFSINLVGVLFLVIFTGFTMWKFFHRKKSAPKYFIILLLILFLTNLTTHLLASFTDILSNLTEGVDSTTYFKETAKSFIYLLIFGMYFLNSKRVKNTFTK